MSGKHRILKYPRKSEVEQLRVEIVVKRRELEALEQKLQELETQEEGWRDDS